MDLSYKREATVGGLVLLAIVLFVAGTTWLSGRSIGKSGDYWRIQFRDIAGLKVSSAVRVSGVSVGRVEDITLEEPGKVMVAVSLDKGITPKTDAAAQIISVGFVGDAVVSLDPGRAATPLPKSQVIAGTMAAGLTDRAEQLSHRADSVMLGLQMILNQRMADDLHQMLATLQATLKSSQRMMDLYANPRQGPTAELVETAKSLRQLSARFDSTLANPALPRLLHHSDTLMTDLSALSRHFGDAAARLDSTLAAVDRGRGTLGKFATDTGLYHDLRATSQSLTNLLDELQRHPGQISPTIKVCIIPKTC